MTKVKTALLSVSDKTGIVAFAQALAAQSVHILSTGGTAALLKSEGVSVTQVSDFTGFPEILGGRVKTLHPKIHSGILADRSQPEHLDVLERMGLSTIDLVVANLYPFEAAVAGACDFATAIENIDIGGPTMLRAAAKNHAHVGVVVDAQDYETVLQEINTQEGLSAALKRHLAYKVFAHTAHYDTAIERYFAQIDCQEGHPAQQDTVLGMQLKLSLQQLQALRYGENPTQQAAFYGVLGKDQSGFGAAQIIQGKALSFNNIADANAAWQCVNSFEQQSCVIVKHANPCGISSGQSCLDAYQRALAVDETSAFGGIIAFNQEVTEETAQALCQRFSEVILAPSFEKEALACLAKKVRLRVLKMPSICTQNECLDIKVVEGGYLVQTQDTAVVDREQMHVVTTRSPTEAEWADLQFAWKAVKFIKSNAIVFCAQQRTLGIGAGQMSRIDSVKIAALKAGYAKLSLQGAAAASDAFFPFRDGLDALAAQGIKAVIQPGGSMRDEEVIEAANAHGIAMVFTGIRHFRH